MNEAMDTKPPVPTETFLNQQLPKIRDLFPDLLKPELVELDTPKFLADLEDKIWGQMGDDPVLKRLGRADYQKLPPEKRYEIIASALDLLMANRKIDEYLSRKK